MYDHFDSSPLFLMEKRDSALELFGRIFSTFFPLSYEQPLMVRESANFPCLFFRVGLLSPWRPLSGIVKKRPLNFISPILQNGGDLFWVHRLIL